MDLEMLVFGDFTLKDLLIYGGCAVGVIMLLSFIRKMFAGEKEDPHSQAARCQSCGWQGRVSVYAGRCPKCNVPLGSQKGRNPGE